VKLVSAGTVGDSVRWVFSVSDTASLSQLGSTWGMQLFFDTDQNKTTPANNYNSTHGYDYYTNVARPLGPSVLKFLGQFISYGGGTDGGSVTQAGWSIWHAENRTMTATVAFAELGEDDGASGR
jgi:hypothetical protein